MLNSVKIIGAGSIGNHLANASRQLGMSVVLCDVDPAALERTESEIYPARYGSWDPNITTSLVQNAPVGQFDLIIIGTPPDSHVELGLKALEEKPQGLLIEKPLSTPCLEGLFELQSRANSLGVRVFVGYDHAVSRSISMLEDVANISQYGDLVTLDVEFREHWHGIFSAHPWLDGPKDTYLGYWARGGGACGEHSHAINMWQHLADISGKGRIVTVSAELDYVNDGICEYDRLCLMQVETESGMKGRIVQDVVTFPVRKEAFLQYENGAVRWQCGGDPKGDVIMHGLFPDPLEKILVEKSRPDDFIIELSHIRDSVNKEVKSPLSLERGLETMLVIAAAHLSGQENRKVSINYNAGPIRDALELL